MYVRIWKLKKMGVDDYLMLACQILFTAYIILQLVSIRYGNGRVFEDLTEHNASEARKYWFICGLTYEPATILLKLSIGSFLLRFTTNRVQAFIVWAVSILCIVFGVVYWFLLLLQCKPISYWWTLDLGTSGTCISSELFLVYGWVAGSLNATADLIYATLPICIVWTSSWRLRAKITVSFILGIGSFAGIATLIRMIYTYSADNVYQYHGNFLYTSRTLAILSTAELGIGITTACAATLRPLFEQWFGSNGTRIQSEFKLYTVSGNKSRNSKFQIWKRGGKSNTMTGGTTTTITGHETLPEMPELVLLGTDDMKEGDIEKGMVVEMGIVVQDLGRD